MDEPYDRISSLPDDVLTHVLSFLSAKEAVQTCILSKRWTNVWASVPVLKFLFKDFFRGVCDDENYDDELKFDRFIQGVFENRAQSRLDTIIYDWRFVNDYCKPSLEWLDRATLLMPRTISVCITGVYLLSFPLSVFSCASLQNLNLSLSADMTNISRPKLIALPSLKSLKLSSLFLNDDFAQNLFLGCPSLESLYLRECHLYISQISSNVLKELKFDRCYLLEHMQICCPNLVSLFISSYRNSIRIISLVNMSSLVSADINLYGTDDVRDPDLPDLSILCGLSNTTSLRLCLCSYLDLKEQWKKEIFKCKMFKNLKSLEIKSQDIMDFDLVACFFEHSPVLQNLTLDLWWLHESIAVAQEEPRQHVCFPLEYLETVKIHCGKNDRLASQVISLLGRYVKTIGNVTISW